MRQGLGIRAHLQPRHPQASQIIVKILLLIVLSYLAWHGAARTEKHLRTEWRAKRELEKASEQMEQQQQVIQAKGQEVLEKDAKVKETMELATRRREGVGAKRSSAKSEDFRGHGGENTYPHQITFCMKSVRRRGEGSPQMFEDSS